jgi:MtN3 and saliva related transmembrane protein
MTSNIYNIVGYIGAICTTVAFVPQVIYTLKTKDTKAISLGMYIIFIIGITSWLIYGLHKEDLPLTLANSVTIVLANIILVCKLKYK